jgi:hypothetical protein
MLQQAITALLARGPLLMPPPPPSADG